MDDPAPSGAVEDPAPRSHEICGRHPAARRAPDAPSAACARKESTRRDLVSPEEARGGGAGRGRRSCDARAGGPARPTPLSPSASRRRAAAAGAAAGAAGRRRPRRGRRRGGGAGRGEAEAGPTPKPAARPRSGRARSRSASSERAPARKPAPARIVVPDVKKEILVSVEVLEQTVAVVEDGQVAEVYLGRPVAPLDRREHLQGRRRQRPPGHGGVVRRRRPRPQRLPLRGRDRRARARGQAPRQAHPGAHLPRPGSPRPGRQDPMGTKGARLTTEISLPGRFLVYTPYGDGIGVSRGSRTTSASASRPSARASSSRGRADRPHRRRGRLRGGARRRPQAPAEALVDHPRPRRAERRRRRSSTRRPSSRSGSCATSSSATSSASSSTTSAPTGRSWRT